MSRRRFVILEHDHPFLHWDFMLEQDGTLKTWRLLDLPSAGAVCRTECLSDHRIEYLTYEGPVSGNRGQVKRVVSGTYEIRDDPGSELSLELFDCDRLTGAVMSDDGQKQNWRFI